MFFPPGTRVRIKPKCIGAGKEGIVAFGPLSGRELSIYTYIPVLYEGKVEPWVTTGIEPISPLVLLANCASC